MRSTAPFAVSAAPAEAGHDMGAEAADTVTAYTDGVDHLPYSTLRRSIHLIIQYSTLIVAQILVAVIMTIIANKFDVRYLGDVTILLWIALIILFCQVSSVGVVNKFLLAYLSIFISTGVYSIFLFIYRTFF